VQIFEARDRLNFFEFDLISFSNGQEFGVCFGSDTVLDFCGLWSLICECDIWVQLKISV
jgi:hypothetical protein